MKADLIKHVIRTDTYQATALSSNKHSGYFTNFLSMPIDPIHYHHVFNLKILKDEITTFFCSFSFHYIFELSE